MTPEEQQRFEAVDYLHPGSHQPDEQKLSITEAVAFVAGERHTLWPTSLSASIAGFADRAGDLARDRERQQFLELIPLMLNSNNPVTEEIAALSICLKALTVWTPVTLAANGWPEEADQLASSTSLPEAAGWANHFLRQMQALTNRQRYNHISQTDHALTMATVAAQAIRPLAHLPLTQEDIHPDRDRMRVHRTAATIAADLMGIACKSAARTQGRGEIAPQITLPTETIITVASVLAPRNA